MKRSPGKFSFLWLFFLIFVFVFLGLLNLSFHSKTDVKSEIEEVSERLEVKLKKIEEELKLLRSEINSGSQQTSTKNTFKRELEARELIKDWRKIPAGKPRNTIDADKFRNSKGVTVLAWTGSLHSNSKVPTYLGAEIREYDCGLECIITYDRKLLPQADAVLFEVQPLAGYGNDYVSRPPSFPQRYPRQFFINSGYEQPHYFHLYAHPGYLVHHDINMTYSQQSQVPVTFFCNWGGIGGTLEELRKPHPPKTKLIAWFGTNCQGIGGHTLRTEWTGELMKYLPVDSYGKCHHNKDMPKEMDFPIYSNHGKSMKNKVLLFQEYKFGLAIENNNVTDYVTEKIFNIFQAGAIPVYMGAPNIDEWLPGENSIIKASDFGSQKELAEYILKVSEDEALYESFFEWKKKPFSEGFITRYNNCLYHGSHCRLCQKIREMKDEIEKEEKQFKVYPNPSTEQYKYRIGNCILFQDKSYIEIPHQSSLDLAESYTIAGWVNPSTVDFMRLVDKGSDGSIDGYSVDLVKGESGQNIHLRLCAANNCFVSKKKVKTHFWTFFAIVFSSPSEEVLIYLNSMIDSIHEVTESTSKNQYPLCFGKVSQGNSFYFEGKLDDISIWSRILSKQEIRRLSFQILNGDERGLVGFWSFNEENGDQVYDWSSNQNNGRIMSASPNSLREESTSKPLILPNVKRNWQDPLEPFMDI